MAVHYRDIVGGDLVLLARSPPEEIVKGMLFEVESKMGTLHDFMAELGVPMEKQDEPGKLMPEMVFRMSLAEWPLSKEEVETYLDLFTARVLEAWEKEEKAALIRENIHLVKEYLFDSSRFPTLRTYMGTDVLFPCEGVGHVVFTEHSSPSEPPKFLFLAYGLRLDDSQVCCPAPVVGSADSTTNSNKRKKRE